MHLIRKSLFFWLALFSCGAFAQYTNVINSNNPGFSESPYSVGSGVYQIEGTWFLRKTRIEPTFSIPRSNGVDFLFRTSFFTEKFELNVNLAYQNDLIGFKNIFESSYYTKGLSKFTVAGKYLLYEQKYKDKSKEVRSWVERHRFDWNRLIPSVAIYAGVNTDFVNDIHQTGGISPKIGVLLQNDLSKKFNVVTNVFYDKLGSDLPEISYIITGTYSLSDRWSTFFENQTIFTKPKISSNIGSGLAFLYNKNLQFNSSVRFILDGKAPGYYTSIGVSYRIDKHADEIIEVDEFGVPIKDVITKEKKGFFKSLFSKATGIFKKKDKKKAAKEVELKQSTIESIRKNMDKDQMTLKNDSVKKIVKPIRTRPKRVRRTPSKIKSKDPKKKKGLFGGLFGGKSDKKKKEKSIDQQLKELDKEQKKLEKEQRKEEARKKKEQARKEKEEKKKKKNDTKKKEGNN